MTAIDALLPLPERAPLPAAPGSVGATLWLAVAEQTRRFRRHARLVGLGSDPEDLHQLRVALRRLRAALALGHEALDLPAPIDAKRLARLGRSLGRLRDLDVVLETLEDLVPVAKGAQGDLLQHAIRRLRAQRRAARRRVRDTLANPDLQRTQRSLRRWVRSPGFFPFAHRPVRDAAELLLNPVREGVTRHEGWTRPARGGRPTAADDGCLHDLRKAIKELRYRVEILTRPVDREPDAGLERLRRIQDVLGGLHDLASVERKVRSGEPGLLEPHRGLVARHLARRRALLLRRWAAIRAARD
jgi:CHAD domain-containing protein